jgi:hypothetical protein
MEEGVAAVGPLGVMLDFLVDENTPNKGSVGKGGKKRTPLSTVDANSPTMVLKDSKPASKLDKCPSSGRKRKEKRKKNITHMYGHSVQFKMDESTEDVQKTLYSPSADPPEAWQTPGETACHSARTDNAGFTPGACTVPKEPSPVISKEDKYKDFIARIGGVTTMLSPEQISCQRVDLIQRTSDASNALEHIPIELIMKDRDETMLGQTSVEKEISETVVEARFVSHDADNEGATAETGTCCGIESTTFTAYDNSGGTNESTGYLDNGYRGSHHSLSGVNDSQASLEHGEASPVNVSNEGENENEQSTSTCQDSSLQDLNLLAAKVRAQADRSRNVEPHAESLQLEANDSESVVLPNMPILSPPQSRSHPRKNESCSFSQLDSGPVLTGLPVTTGHVASTPINESCASSSSEASATYGYKGLMRGPTFRSDGFQKITVSDRTVPLTHALSTVLSGSTPQRIEGVSLSKPVRGRGYNTGRVDGISLSKPQARSGPAHRRQLPPDVTIAQPLRAAQVCATHEITSDERPGSRKADGRGLLEKFRAERAAATTVQIGNDTPFNLVDCEEAFGCDPDSPLGQAQGMDNGHSFVEAPTDANIGDLSRERDYDSKLELHMRCKKQSAMQRNEYDVDEEEKIDTAFDDTDSADSAILSISRCYENDTPSELSFVNKSDIEALAAQPLGSERNVSTRHEVSAVSTTARESDVYAAAVVARAALEGAGARERFSNLSEVNGVSPIIVFPEPHDPSFSDCTTLSLDHDLSLDDSNGSVLGGALGSVRLEIARRPSNVHSGQTRSSEIKEIVVSGEPGVETDVLLHFRNSRPQVQSMRCQAFETHRTGPSGGGAAFSLFPPTLKLAAGANAAICLTFKPPHDGTFSGAVKIKSGGRSFVLLLRGTSSSTDEDCEESVSPDKKLNPSESETPEEFVPFMDPTTRAGVEKRYSFSSERPMVTKAECPRGARRIPAQNCEDEKVELITQADIGIEISELEEDGMQNECELSLEAAIWHRPRPFNVKRDELQLQQAWLKNWLRHASAARARAAKEKSPITEPKDADKPGCLLTATPARLILDTASENSAAALNVSDIGREIVLTGFLHVTNPSSTETRHFWAEAITRSCDGVEINKLWVPSDTYSVPPGGVTSVPIKAVFAAFTNPLSPLPPSEGRPAVLKASAVTPSTTKMCSSTGFLSPGSEWAAVRLGWIIIKDRRGGEAVCEIARPASALLLDSARQCQYSTRKAPSSMTISSALPTSCQGWQNVTRSDEVSFADQGMNHQSIETPTMSVAARALMNLGHEEDDLSESTAGELPSVLDSVGKLDKWRKTFLQRARIKD